MVQTRSRSQSSRQPRPSGSQATDGSGSQVSHASSARTKPARRKAAATTNMIDHAPPGTSRVFQAIKLLACVCGIYSAYITQGLFQEILSTKKFGGSERFPHLATLNAFQSFACFLWAGGLILVSEVLFSSSKSKKEDASHPSFTAYVAPGFTNCFGPALGFQALYYIPYPAQVRTLIFDLPRTRLVSLGTPCHPRVFSCIIYVSLMLSVTTAAGTREELQDDPRHAAGHGPAQKDVPADRVFLLLSGDGRRLFVRLVRPGIRIQTNADYSKTRGKKCQKIRIYLR